MRRRRPGGHAPDARLQPGVGAPAQVLHGGVVERGVEVPGDDEAGLGAGSGAIGPIAVGPGAAALADNDLDGGEPLLHAPGHGGVRVDAQDRGPPVAVELGPARRAQQDGAVPRARGGLRLLVVPEDGADQDRGGVGVVLLVAGGEDGVAQAVLGQEVGDRLAVLGARLGQDHHLGGGPADRDGELDLVGLGVVGVEAERGEGPVPVGGVGGDGAGGGDRRRGALVVAQSARAQDPGVAAGGDQQNEGGGGGAAPALAAQDPDEGGGPGDEGHEAEADDEPAAQGDELGEGVDHGEPGRVGGEAEKVGEEGEQREDADERHHRPADGAAHDAPGGGTASARGIGPGRGIGGTGPLGGDRALRRGLR